MAVNFVFMTILPPNALGLDPVTERAIQRGLRDALLRRRGRDPRSMWRGASSSGASSSGALSSGASSSRAPHVPQLLLELDAGIWVHLLTNTMSEYQPGAIECEPGPENLNPRPNPDDACRPSSSRPRDLEDLDDLDAQRGTKRPPLHSLNKDPIPNLNNDPIPNLNDILED